MRIPLPRRLLVALGVGAVLALAPTVARAQLFSETLTASTSTCAANAAGSPTCLVVPGFPSGVTVQIGDTASGTWTVTFEVTLDGVTWAPITMFPKGSTTGVSTATAAGIWSGAAGAKFRVRPSAYTSGVIRVNAFRTDVPMTSGGGGAGGGSDGVAQGSLTSGQAGVLGQCAATTAAPSYTTGTTNPCSVDLTGAMRVAITSGAGTGGFSVADRSGTFTPNVTSFNPGGGYMDEVASDACTEGAPCAFRVTSTRSLYVTGANGTFPSSQSGTWTVQPGNTANSTAWLVTGTGGTFPVTDSGGSLTVDNAGTFATQPAGSLAHDGAAAAVNPVLVGAYASAAAPTDVSADIDAVRLWALRNGALAVQPTYSGVLGSTDAGNTGTGTVRVIEATNSQLSAGVGATGDAAATAGSTGSLNAKLRFMSGAFGATPATAFANPTNALTTWSLNGCWNGTTWDRCVVSADPCTNSAKTVIPINISTATTTELTPSLAGASNFYYVCSINLGPTSALQNFALVDDDTDNCVSVTSGMAGGTTAGSGWNFAANGGMWGGNGAATILKTNGTNRVICAVTSAAAQISGVMTVVAAP